MKLPIIFGVANNPSALLVYGKGIVHFCNTDLILTAADESIRKIERVGILVIVRGGIDAVCIGIDQPFKMIIGKNIVGFRLETEKPLGIEIPRNEGAVGINVPSFASLVKIKLGCPNVGLDNIIAALINHLGLVVYEGRKVSAAVKLKTVKGGKYRVIISVDIFNERIGTGIGSNGV